MAKEPFNTGDKVAHKVFGEGTVVEIDDDGFPGDSDKLTIEFSGDFSEKKIIAKFVKHA